MRWRSADALEVAAATKRQLRGLWQGALDVCKPDADLDVQLFA